MKNDRTEYELEKTRRRRQVPRSFTVRLFFQNKFIFCEFKSILYAAKARVSFTYEPRRRTFPGFYDEVGSEGP